MIFKEFIKSRFTENTQFNPIVQELNKLILSGFLNPNMPLKEVLQKIGNKPNSNFETDFERAFYSLDDGYNFVKLYDLRNALSNYSRQEFDEGLNNLRRKRKYSLEASEGLLVKLTPEEKAAGITELGRLLIYCKKIQ